MLRDALNVLYCWHDVRFMPVLDHGRVNVGANSFEGKCNFLVRYARNRAEEVEPAQFIKDISGVVCPLHFACERIYIYQSASLLY